MSEDLITELESSINQKQELTATEKKEKERQRSIIRERIRRYRQRRKLKEAAADFINRLHLYTVNHLDKTTMNVINVTLRNILELRAHWTDKDLRLAFNSLRGLEKKYLGRARSKVSNEKLQLQTKVTNLIFQANIKEGERLEVVLDVLDSVAKNIVSQGGGLEPSRANTIALLTQDLSNGVPDWFGDAAIKLLAEKYTGGDLTEMLLKFRKILSKKKLLEGYLKDAEDGE